MAIPRRGSFLVQRYSGANNYGYHLNPMPACVEVMSPLWVNCSHDQIRQSYNL